MNRLKEEQREEKRRLLGLPIYSASEEILSAVSHGIGVSFIDRGAGASFGERSRRSDCDCVLVYLQRHVNSFIFGFHPVSRFRSEQGKEGVPHLGPLLHFFC